MKYVKTIMLVVLVTVSIASTSEASWLIYHKPEFKGKIVDAETKQPIEGAVVVAVYNKTTIGLGAGTLSSIINVREASTNKDGMFCIRSYTTIIQPFSWSSSTTFIVFKPGYASISDFGLETTLSEDTDRQQVELPWIENRDLKFVFAPRLIGLPKVKTKEDRWHASFVGVTGYSEKELPLLYNALSADKASGKGGTK